MIPYAKAKPGKVSMANNLVPESAFLLASGRLVHGGVGALFRRGFSQRSMGSTKKEPTAHALSMKDAENGVNTPGFIK